MKITDAIMSWFIKKDGLYLVVYHNFYILENYPLMAIKGGDFIQKIVKNIQEWNCRSYFEVPMFSCDGMNVCPAFEVETILDCDVYDLRAKIGLETLFKSILNIDDPNLYQSSFLDRVEIAE